MEEVVNTVSHVPQLGALLYTEATGVPNDVQNWFKSVDRDNSGNITWHELKCCLVNAQGNMFNDNTCKVLITMFDRNKLGKIDVYEFGSLFNYVQKWVECFKVYDADKTGHIEKLELMNAFQNMGYTFSEDFINFLIVQIGGADNKRVSVDQFILICIQIQRLTEEFRNRDTTRTGVIDIRFEDLLLIAFEITP